jgi:mannose/fructose/N-acetylgalactosamine-specific phosphotransferase system component IID
MANENENNTVMRGINSRVFCRSFFLETLWNYEKLQNVGFVYCIYPALERLYPDSQERLEAMKRHMGKVNTHPLMGPVLVGVSARLEQEKGESAVPTSRGPVMNALAALGDRIFWVHVKPLAAIGGILGCMCFMDSLVGSVVFLLVYNVPHFLVRSRGFAYGWQEGIAVLARFRTNRVDRVILTMGWAISLGLGIVTGAVVLSSFPTGVICESLDEEHIKTAAIGIAGITGFWAVSKGLSVELALYSLAVVTLILVFCF